MSGSHNKDALINDMLADMCGLIVKTIALIPPEHDDERLSALRLRPRRDQRGRCARCERRPDRTLAPSAAY